MVGILSDNEIKSSKKFSLNNKIESNDVKINSNNNDKGGTTTDNPKTVYEYALWYRSQGLTVIPVVYKGKNPALDSWKEYQERQSTEEEIKKWFSNDTKYNIGIVCGKTSDNLVVIDFDDGGVYEKWLKHLEENHGELKPIIDNTRKEKSGKGAHIFLRLKINNKADKEYLRTQKPFINKVDILGNGSIVVVTPSIHKSGVKYELIPPTNNPIAEISADNFRAILDSIKELETHKKETKKTKAKEKKEKQKEIDGKKNEKDDSFFRLDDSNISTITELLIPFYTEGNRHDLSLYFAGWGTQEGIHPLDVAKIVKNLYSKKDDKDDKCDRIYTIRDSYLIAGYDISKYKDELEQIWEIKKDDSCKYDSNPRQNGIKGKSGIFEIIKKQLISKGMTEEEAKRIALDTVGKIQTIFDKVKQKENGTIEISKTNDGSVAVVIDYNQFKIFRKVKEKYEIVARGVPEKVTQYISPIDDTDFFEVWWHVKDIDDGGKVKREYTKHYGPDYLDDIINYIKQDGLSESKRYFEEFVNTAIMSLPIYGRGEVVQQLTTPGVYYHHGELTFINVEIKEPDVGGLKNALLTLEELKEWYSKSIEKLATILRWGAVAPLGYAYKQSRGFNGEFIPWLLLSGNSRTGKSTLGRVILYLYGLAEYKEEQKDQYIEVGSATNTEYRLGEALRKSTFPRLVNEPGKLFEEKGNIDMIKGAVEGPIARAIGVRGRRRRVPSLALLIITTNNEPPEDDALINRFIIIRFSFGETKDKDVQERFIKEMLPKLPQLKAIGNFFLWYVKNHPEIIKKDWGDIAIELWNAVYEYVGLSMPEWLKLEVTEEEDPIAETRLAIKSYIKAEINNYFDKHFPKFMPKDPESDNVIMKEYMDFKERVKWVVRSGEGGITWLHYKIDNNGKEWVIISNEITKGLIEEGIYKNGLKSIAELFGLEYKPIRTNEGVIKGIIMELEKFTEWLEGNWEINQGTEGA